MSAPELIEVLEMAVLCVQMRPGPCKRWAHRRRSPWLSSRTSSTHEDATRGEAIRGG